MREIASVVWSNGKSRVGLIIVLVFLLVAFFGPWLAPYSVNDNTFASTAPPSAVHWLGTTQTGQDVLTQLIVGTRASLLITFSVGVLATLVSLCIGLLAGYAPGVLDESLSFLTNVFLVLPGLPLLIVLASYAPGKGTWLIIVIVSLTSWPFGARVLRSQVATLRTRDFVIAARLVGDRTWRILAREIMPNMVSLVVAHFLMSALSGLLTAVGLEFLGLGNPDITTWGSMLYWAQNDGALLEGQWAWILAPGLCIALLGMSLVLINFSVDEVSNPKLRRAL